MIRIQPVILAGGTGSRLWPLSREMFPKQLLRLTEDCSLLQTTLLRAAGLPNTLPPVVVVGEEHRFVTRSQIEELEIIADHTILLEAEGRDTAPAICGAVEFCSHTIREENVVLLVMAADHVIKDTGKFQKAVEAAAALAMEGFLVTFGIVPVHPETGYGYIEMGDGHEVASFTEKPDQAVARRYLASGRHYWNSGMLVFSAETFREEMELHGPTTLASMKRAVQEGEKDGCFFRFNAAAMRQCPRSSIDYTLMEKTGRAAMVVADFGWSDIGSWQAIWQILDKDAAGNVCQGDVTAVDTRNSLIHSESMLVATVGLEDMLVVQTADAVLVGPLSRAQDVRKVVDRLKARKRKEFSCHRTVHRPWGSYTVLEEQHRYQIKRITVRPKARLSLQMHHHRYEHWVVVKGTAKVTNGAEVMLLYENESTFIPAGTVHRLENPGVIALELIEVQIGPYLGEDDIVRFDSDSGEEK